MAEAPDRESKTEEPTERRIEQALEKGNVPMSREAALAAALAAMLLIALTVLPETSRRFGTALAIDLADAATLPLDTPADAATAILRLLTAAAIYVAPPLALLAFAGVAAPLVQTPPRAVGERIRPKLERISLIQGARRIFGFAGLGEFAKSTVKLIAVVILVGVVLNTQREELLNVLATEPTLLPMSILDLSVKLLAAVCAMTLLVMVADVVWSRFAWLKGLRMTHREVRDELRDVEGDPMLKARQRSRARERLRQRMMATVPRATLVIANPTHYAVALRYVRAETAAPVVVAKGRDLIALRIREIAEDNDIPVVENKPLARALHDAVDVDRTIPPEFYKAVAEIVYALHTQRPGVRAAR
jgi:flagellar biosynthetic protein FlhB